MRTRVEIGPHWVADVLFESVAEREAIAEEAFSALFEHAKMMAQLKRANHQPNLRPAETAYEAAADERRQEIENSLARASEIWAGILPVTNEATKLLGRLPPEHRLWALAQIVGDTIAQISETKEDATVRAQYVSSCVATKIAETFRHRGEAWRDTK